MRFYFLFSLTIMAQWWNLSLDNGLNKDAKQTKRPRKAKTIFHANWEDSSRDCSIKHRPFLRRPLSVLFAFTTLYCSSHKINYEKWKQNSELLEILNWSLLSKLNNRTSLRNFLLDKIKSTKIKPKMIVLHKKSDLSCATEPAHILSHPIVTSFLKIHKKFPREKSEKIERNKKGSFLLGLLKGLHAAFTTTTINATLQIVVIAHDDKLW